MSGQKYILVRRINNDVQYAAVTNTGGTKIVKDIKKATVFASKAKAEERKRHSPKRLKSYKITPCTDASASKQSKGAKKIHDVAVSENEAKSEPIVLDPVEKTEKRKKFSQSERETIYNRSEGRCGICGRFVPYGEFTVDHIVPLAKGGKNDLDNLQCACKSCNQLKGSMDYETFTQKAVAIILMRAEADQDFREELYKVLKSRKRIRKKIRAVSI